MATTLRTGCPALASPGSNSPRTCGLDVRTGRRTSRRMPRGTGPSTRCRRPCGTHADHVDTSTRLASTGVERSALLAAIADPVRWNLLAHLADGIPRCVCDLQPVVAVAANLLSYHLKVLREADLVRASRRGRWMDYTITVDALDRLRAAIPNATAADAPPRAPVGVDAVSLTIAGGPR